MQRSSVKIGISKLSFIFEAGFRREGEREVVRFFDRKTGCICRIAKEVSDMIDLTKRSLLTLLDFSSEEIAYLLDLAARLKADKYIGKEKKTLEGKEYRAAVREGFGRAHGARSRRRPTIKGARVTYLGPTGSQMGKKESLKDTARVLGRIYDGIEYRGYGQHVVRTLAEYSGVPVWNGLTTEFHPTQALADALTMREHIANTVV